MVTTDLLLARYRRPGGEERFQRVHQNQKQKILRLEINPTFLQAAVFAVAQVRGIFNILCEHETTV